jgi:hypothetical protein
VLVENLFKNNSRKQVTRNFHKRFRGQYHQA